MPGTININVVLPWRDRPAGERNPYAVWISEIMAQQTRLETVVDYFDRWMKRYPTIEALHGADQQDVLKQWEGLGYYARARNLHKAACIIVEDMAASCLMIGKPYWRCRELANTPLAPY